MSPETASDSESRHTRLYTQFFDLEETRCAMYFADQPVDAPAYAVPTWLDEETPPPLRYRDVRVLDPSVAPPQETLSAADAEQWILSQAQAGRLEFLEATPP